MADARDRERLMGPIGKLLGLPVAGPLLGLGWLACRIAEAAAAEMNDPAHIEAELLALECLLASGEIDEETYEAREAPLLDLLDALETEAVPADIAAAQGTR